ncbi:MAG: hypothetical protein KJP08_10560 [Gammaproteobacteria bacterium]|nr:hypothetical protein [Gammaproteobacteria bacterium]NNF48661.1 hypothetical protein [Woeseiaceae bacterium]MBT8095242.1 hypothetical protein [Gammaproteobacteria bacterium]MBT8105103.1 hypothetical protein [Gammaproteobacteria bacterium]NNK25117.1 hypothetical protein [Woeseiaceae bacterium]
MSESNPIRVFATHNFDESDDYLRVFEFLECVDRFYYLNVSKPENMPTTGGGQALRDEIIAQVKASEAVIVLASAWEQNKDLVNFMMKVAEANQIAKILIKPFGGLQESPPELVALADEHIEWNDREMVDAIKRQARGEDTTRWEVVDFPGFDESGPIE